ncbi:NAD(P)H-dependent oxidoreductase [Endozoicomonas sp. SM1973]|uniref:NAD(P)H-dependent oxidoreductase n=1 Tax=Spartinivicinus marinus TaxID=2994442 RepID=A0A853I7S1_9GAMM|nr:NAD(P)H-dependent oxidoreductase [Spartinivicinus marinus]MCX4026836.1 NAD(P)H-dependent oxidoreductase [Spartinivicinus marinus]NYZ69363.1 NAD(P)H-dependent oxidoreductase [Spartinivicinus marinus]
MKVLAFAASNNKNSINQRLALYVASLIENAVVETLDINDYEMPIFSEEREKQLGQPKEAKAFFNKFTEVDAIIVSFAEHNGNFTAAFKNLYDWTSRIDKAMFGNKPTLFLATSPGPSGAKSVLVTAEKSASFMGADLKGSISIPNFFENFDTENNRLINPVLKIKIKQAAAQLVEATTPNQMSINAY